MLASAAHSRMVKAPRVLQTNHQASETQRLRAQQAALAPAAQQLALGCWCCPPGGGGGDASASAGGICSATLPLLSLQPTVAASPSLADGAQAVVGWASARCHASRCWNASLVKGRGAARGVALLPLPMPSGALLIRLLHLDMAPEEPPARSAMLQAAWRA